MHPSIIFAVGMFAMSASAMAQEAAGYPVKPIRFMIPYAPGGGGDIVGRAIASKLSEVLGQQLVVENRGGAGGMLGTEAVVKSPADGYNLVLTNLALMAISPNMVKKPPYDALKDLAAVGGVAQSVNVLVASMNAPFANARELVAYARNNPGKLSYASSGVGSFGHLSGEILRGTAGAQMVHVPFKTSAAAFPDVIEGRVTMAFDSVSSSIAHVRAGKVKPIAVMADRRASLLPTTPTFTEEGFPEVTLRFWTGIHGPAGMPAAAVQRLNDALAKALNAQDLRERFTTIGQDPFVASAKELDAMVRADFTKLAKAIQAAGIVPE
jgi:tripartite-type tricarboxylate transporter receptor subunit TctC